MNRRRRARLQEASSLLSKALDIVDDAREEEQESEPLCTSLGSLLQGLNLEVA